LGQNGDSPWRTALADASMGDTHITDSSYEVNGNTAQYLIDCSVLSASNMELYIDNFLYSYTSGTSTGPIIDTGIGVANRVIISNFTTNVLAGGATPKTCAIIGQFINISNWQDTSSNQLFNTQITIPQGINTIVTGCKMRELIISSLATKSVISNCVFTKNSQFVIDAVECTWSNIVYSSTVSSGGGVSLNGTGNKFSNIHFMPMGTTASTLTISGANNQFENCTMPTSSSPVFVIGDNTQMTNINMGGLSFTAIPQYCRFVNCIVNGALNFTNGDDISFSGCDFLGTLGTGIALNRTHWTNCLFGGALVGPQNFAGDDMRFTQCRFGLPGGATVTDITFITCLRPQLENCVFNNTGIVEFDSTCTDGQLSNCKINNTGALTVTGSRLSFANCDISSFVTAVSFTGTDIFLSGVRSVFTGILTLGASQMKAINCIFDNSSNTLITGGLGSYTNCEFANNGLLTISGSQNRFSQCEFQSGISASTWSGPLLSMDSCWFNISTPQTVTSSRFNFSNNQVLQASITINVAATESTLSNNIFLVNCGVDTSFTTVNGPLFVGNRTNAALLATDIHANSSSNIPTPV
jgi:hypothetical protein